MLAGQTGNSKSPVQAPRPTYPPTRRAVSSRPGSAITCRIHARIVSVRHRFRDHRDRRASGACSSRGSRRCVRRGRRRSCGSSRKRLCLALRPPNQDPRGAARGSTPDAGLRPLKCANQRLLVGGVACIGPPTVRREPLTGTRRIGCCTRRRQRHNRGRCAAQCPSGGATEHRVRRHAICRGTRARPQCAWAVLRRPQKIRPHRWRGTEVCPVAYRLLKRTHN